MHRARLAAGSLSPSSRVKQAEIGVGVLAHEVSPLDPGVQNVSKYPWQIQLKRDAAARRGAPLHRRKRRAPYSDQSTRAGSRRATRQAGMAVASRVIATTSAAAPLRTIGSDALTS